MEGEGRRDEGRCGARMALPVLPIQPRPPWQRHLEDGAAALPRKAAHLAAVMLRDLPHEGEPRAHALTGLRTPREAVERGKDPLALRLGDSGALLRLHRADDLDTHGVALKLCGQVGLGLGTPTVESDDDHLTALGIQTDTDRHHPR